MNNKIKLYLKYLFRSFIWLAVILLAVDILTKQIILSQKVTSGSIIADWKFVRISFVLNYNAAFGLGASDHDLSRTLYLIIASIIVLVIIIGLIIKRKETKLLTRCSLVLIATGAVGNMIDRLFYGPEYAVVDWIDFYWFWPYNFNIADCCIVIGAFMMIIYTIVIEIKEMIKARNEDIKHINDDIDKEN